MSSYPQMTADYIDWELDGVQGWAYYNWARQHANSVFGGGEKVVSDRYVKQEFKKLMAEYHGVKK